MYMKVTKITFIETEAYLEPSQTSAIELFAEIVNG